MAYSKLILDALVQNPDDKDVSRMVVIINESAVYQDFADFHKHDPEWWEALANKVYETSAYPKMALAPLTIAASQYLCDPEQSLEDKIVPLIGKAMAINDDHQPTQRLAKITLALKMGGMERPDVHQIRNDVLPKVLRLVKQLDEKLALAQEE